MTKSQNTILLEFLEAYANWAGYISCETECFSQFYDGFGLCGNYIIFINQNNNIQFPNDFYILTDELKKDFGLNASFPFNTEQTSYDKESYNLLMSKNPKRKKWVLDKIAELRGCPTSEYPF